MNGANGKDTKTARPLGIRVIHKPCKGRKGARFTVSKDHQEQRDREDNIKILKMLVNGASIKSIQRVLTCPRTGERAGMSRIYDRIFRLERTLLAFEGAQLGKWRKDLERRGVFRHTRVAHDDIVLGINWETSADRRITALNCTASTDIQSGYVRRRDVDFAPRVDPVAAFKDAYLEANRNRKNLHGRYRYSSQNFVAPLLHYQRPTGRFDQAAFFGACQSSLRLFALQTEDAFGAAALPPEVQQAGTEAWWFADAAELVGEGWFGLSEMLPPGKMPWCQSRKLSSRMAPHIFRDEILSDRFEWLAISFDKEATKPKVQQRVGVFRSNLEQFRQSYTGQVVSD